MTAQNAERHPFPERVVLAVLGVGIALAAAYLFLRTLGVLPAGALLPAGAAEGPALGWIEQLPTWGRFAAAGGALVVGLLALTSIRSPRPRERSNGNGLHVLEADERGLVLIARAGIESVVRAAVERTAGVVASEAEVRPRGDGVALVVDIGIVDAADVRTTGLAARDRAVDAVKRLIGFDVHDVKVRVEVLSPEELGRAVL